MQINHIVIDTNVIIQSYRFNNKDLLKLIKTRKLYKFEIYIPKVVYDESIGNFKDSSKNQYLELEKSIDNANKLLSKESEINKSSILKKISKSDIYFKKRFDKFISENKIKLLPYPKISHQDIVGRMYETKIPFKSTKRELGYKDYLITMSIIEHSEKISKAEKIALLTNNVKDFAEPEESEKNSMIRLHPTYGAKNITVTSSFATIFQELSKSLKDRQNNHTINIPNGYISNILKDLIIKDTQLYEKELFGIFLFLTYELQISCNVKESAIEIYEDEDFIEISGLMNININLKLDIDEYDLKNILRSDFIFKDIVKNEITDMIEYPYTINDMKDTNEFYFNYMDFSYKEKQYLSQENINMKNSDPYLTILRI